MQEPELPLLLVVEDNELNADMLLRRLKRNGFRTAWAADGDQALTMAAALRPALILMDLSLPIKDGYTATRELKAGCGRDIPVIALTAHARMEDQTQAYAAGADDFETKPVNFAALLKKIHLHLGEHQ